MAIYPRRSADFELRSKRRRSVKLRKYQRDEIQLHDRNPDRRIPGRTATDVFHIEREVQRRRLPIVCPSPLQPVKLEPPSGAAASITVAEGKNEGSE
jgi:hypothetical protein